MSGAVGVQQHGHLVGDVREGGQHRRDAALVAVGEVLDVLVQGGQAHPVGQVDGDQCALIQDVPVGDEPQLHAGDVRAAVQPVRPCGQHVVDGGQESIRAVAEQFVVHTEAFGAGETVGVAGVAQPRLRGCGIEGECSCAGHGVPPWVISPRETRPAACTPGPIPGTVHGRSGPGIRMSEKGWCVTSPLVVDAVSVDRCACGGRSAAATCATAKPAHGLGRRALIRGASRARRQRRAGSGSSRRDHCWSVRRLVWVPIRTLTPCTAGQPWEVPGAVSPNASYRRPSSMPNTPARAGRSAMNAWMSMLRCGSWPLSPATPHNCNTAVRSPKRTTTVGHCSMVSPTAMTGYWPSAGPYRCMNASKVSVMLWCSSHRWLRCWCCVASTRARPPRGVRRPTPRCRMWLVVWHATYDWTESAVTSCR